MAPHAFVSMCRNLRVLNAVRDFTVGIPLTYGQYPLLPYLGARKSPLALILSLIG